MLDKGIGLELGNNLIGNRKCRKFEVDNCRVREGPTKTWGEIIRKDLERTQNTSTGISVKQVLNRT